MPLTPESGHSAEPCRMPLHFICASHPENRFVEMITARKGVLKTKDGPTASLVDNYASVSLNRETLS